MFRRESLKGEVMIMNTASSTAKFDKELFKKSVAYNVKTLYRKTLEEATTQQIFQAVSYTVKDTIVDNWMETQKAYDKEDPKMRDLLQDVSYNIMKIATLKELT